MEGAKDMTNTPTQNSPSAQEASPPPPRIWLQTASGAIWDLDRIDDNEIQWSDIADSLAKICRFNGHVSQFYSVAQHCCHVADLLPVELRIYGLLHDAHEAITGDITAPIKRFLSATRTDGAIRYLVTRIDQAIYRAAGIAPPGGDYKITDAVQYADLVALATEKRDLCAPSRIPVLDWGPLPEPDKKPLTPWPWPRAADEWLTRLRDLTQKG